MRSVLIRRGINTSVTPTFRWSRTALPSDSRHGLDIATRFFGIGIRRTILGLVGLTYYYNCCSTTNGSHRPFTTCEAIQEETSVVSNDDSSIGLIISGGPSLSPSWWNVFFSSLYRTCCILKRCVQLMITFTPMITLYPFYHCLLLCRPADPSGASTDAQDIALGLQYQDCGEVDGISLRSSLANRLIQWYYQLCLFSVEQSGATIVKFMQWVSTRPDLFGYNFCLIFSKLQDHTTPHARRHTERMLRDAYGPDWRDTIQLGPVIGSGCIGQVYRGSVAVSSNGDISSDSNDKPEYQQVAIKVLHPHVRQSIDTDLDILRCIVRLLPYIPFTKNIYEQCKWLNLNGIVEEFALLLKMQMDLRNEAQHLQKFNRNFAKDQVIQFPQLIQHVQPTSNVLMETFCEGTPVLQYCREHRHDRSVLSKLCYHGIRAVCQMIFLDNFVHGDLHPGNVYISKDGSKFILFDVGIVNEYSTEDHNILIDILSAFIRKDGRKAGRCMIDDSNSKMLMKSAAKDEMARHEEEYIDKIEMLTIKASTEGYFMEHLGTYISYICNAAATHHVMMNPSFVTAALAVKIQEGIALAMDPSCTIPDIAIPIIVESERRRFMKGQKAHWLDRFEAFRKAFFGEQSEQETK